MSKYLNYEPVSKTDYNLALNNALAIIDNKIAALQMMGWHYPSIKVLKELREQIAKEWKA